MSLSEQFTYQVGGSLRANAPSYLTRQADQQLYEALEAGEFCYILNARQVGKSSLRVRLKARLEADGYRCASIDMTSIGSETLTSEQWYKGVLSELWRSFGLGSLAQLRAWLKEQESISSVQVLHRFIEEILLVQIPGNLVIFMDEIDSVLSLPFSVGDFFALIRFCYDHRSDDATYNRLTFALLGVATPSDLIRAHTRTPFNIGRAIELSGLTIEESLPLAQGLVDITPDPQALLSAILDWTGGQPFLTQKLCQILVEKCQLHPDFCDLSMQRAAVTVENLVQETILDDWERQDEPEHLKTIRDRLLYDETRFGRLLGLYQRLLQGETIRTDDSRDQMELLLSGLVVRQHGTLQIKCRLYQAVFNLEWVQRHLNLLRPYAQAIQAWENDPTDESWLLRGSAFAEAQAWSQGKSLSDLDYRFIAASEALDRRMMEESLELARAKELANRLAQEQKSTRQQRSLIMALTGLLVVALGLATLTYLFYRRAVKSEQDTAIAAVQSRAFSAQALVGSEQRLDAIVEAVQAKRQLNALQSIPAASTLMVESALRKAVYRAVERNRFNQGSALRAVDVRGDGQMIASAGIDGTVKLWQSNGKLIATLKELGSLDGIFGLKFSPQGDSLATASGNGTIKLWSTSGKLLWNIVGHQGAAHAVTFSPDGQRLATVGADQTVKIWTLQGKLLKTLKGHTGEVWGVAFSPNGQILATGSRDQTVKLWRADGTLLHTLSGYTGAVRALAFSPDGKVLATGSDDNTVRIWNVDGTLITAYRAHDDVVQAIAYAPRGNFFVTASWDNTVRIWSPDGVLLRELKGHRDRVWTLSIVPDETTIISGSWDQTIRLWQIRNTLTTPLIGHKAAILAVAFSPDGSAIASASDDKTVRLWNLDGTTRTIFRGHSAETYGVAFSPNGHSLASSSLDRTVKIWERSGQLRSTLTGHQGDIWSVVFSPNGQELASASFDNTARLWSLDGQVLQIFKGHQSRVRQVAFSPLGNAIATASFDHTARLWSLDGKVQTIFQGHEGAVNSVSFSPDGQMLVTGSADQTLKLWQRDGQLVKTLSGHTAEVTAVKFSPNGLIIASSSFDGLIKLWRRDGSLITTLEGHRGRVWDIAFSPNGSQLASAGEDKLVLIWDLAKVLNVNNVKTFACLWLQDYLQNNALLSDSDRRLCR